MDTKTIIQNENFNMSPQEFYNAFMNSESHTEIIGSEAVISQVVGGEFSAHGGYCWGKNLELVPGKRIVQSWIAPDENWPEDHESRIILNLSGDESGTQLEFIHEDVPVEAAESIANGWIEYYWEPMRDWIQSN